MNDSTVTTHKKKISKKAAKVAGKAKAAKVKTLAPKATKPKKPTAAQLKAARKLLASQNPLAEAREILKAAKCTSIMIAAEGPGGFFSVGEGFGHAPPNCGGRLLATAKVVDAILSEPGSDVANTHEDAGRPDEGAALGCIRSTPTASRPAAA